MSFYSFFLVCNRRKTENEEHYVDSRKSLKLTFLSQFPLFFCGFSSNGTRHNAQHLFNSFSDFLTLFLEKTTFTSTLGKSLKLNKYGRAVQLSFVFLFDILKTYLIHKLMLNLKKQSNLTLKNYNIKFIIKPLLNNVF